MKTGFIYVITNKAMPGIVKIGYSKDVNKRLNSLYSSNVPFPFEVYATLEGVTESADKEIHKFLPSSLRVNNNREFFNITPEYAYDILFQISKVFGVTNRLRKWDEISSEKDNDDASKKSRTAKLDLVPYNGKTLVLEANKNVTCKVVGNKVEFMGKKYSLSNLTVRLHGGKNMCGPWGWWLCDGKPLHGSLNRRNSPWPKNEWNIDIPIEPTTSQSKALKPRHLQRIGFWKKFNEVSSQMGSSIGTIGEKGLKRPWNYFSIGGGKCHIEVSLNNKNHNVSIYYFTATQNVYTKMNPLTSKIESECGKKLTWKVRSTKDRFSAFLGTKIEGFDFDDVGNYSIWAKQIIETVEAMKQAYQKVVLQ